MKILIIVSLGIAIFGFLRWCIEEIKGDDREKCRDCNKVVIYKTYNDILSSGGSEDKENYRTRIAPSTCRYIRKFWKFWRPK